MRFSKTASAGGGSDFSDAEAAAMLKQLPLSRRLLAGASRSGTARQHGCCRSPCCCHFHLSQHCPRQRRRLLWLLLLLQRVSFGGRSIDLIVAVSVGTGRRGGSGARLCTPPPIFPVNIIERSIAACSPSCCEWNMRRDQGGGPRGDVARLRDAAGPRAAPPASSLRPLSGLLLWLLQLLLLTLPWLLLLLLLRC